jgi:hypothetical protein
MLGHWPENLLAVLFLLGTFLVMFCGSLSLPLRLLLVPVGWLLAFGVWVGVIWVVGKIHDKWMGRK